MLSLNKESVIQKSLIYIFLFILSIIQLGCASIAHSPYACEATSAHGLWYGWFYKLMGNITQIGDCASSKTLKIETGDYYRFEKNKIDKEVQRGLNENEGFELNSFARAFNCRKESFPKFHSEIRKNKIEIFGQQFDRSPREVTKAIQKIIESDEDLSKACK